MGVIIAVLGFDMIYALITFVVFLFIPKRGLKNLFLARSDVLFCFHILLSFHPTFKNIFSSKSYKM